MKDSNMSDEWVKAQWAKIPCEKVIYKGVWTGDIRTGPVRLSFPHIFSPGKPVPPNTEGTYGASLLFPLGADITALMEDAKEKAKAKWGDQMGKIKLKSPFLSQTDDAERYAGYEPGAVLIRTRANQRVDCVDARRAPVVDESRVYPGVWALCLLRSFAYDKGVNKGVGFGLQGVMLVADDVNIGGTGRVNMNDAFAGVSIDAGDINPDAAFGAGERVEAGQPDPFA